MACIYQPDGRCTYMLPPEQVAILYHRYQYMQQQHPRKMQKLKAGTFAEEIHKLASRQHEGTIGSLKHERYTVEAKNQRCMPRPLRSILQEIIGCTKERFSSPLTVLPGTEEYWTVHEQDQVFGARCDAYRTCWTGASTACPDFTAQAANKAVLWALQSAVQAPTPTLTLLLLPTYSKDAKSTSHMRWIKQHPEYCKQLVTLPTSAVPLELPANTRHPPAASLKWNTQLVAIGNKTGFETYLPYWKVTEGLSWRHKFLEAIQAALENSPSDNTKVQRIKLHEEQADWWSSPPQPDKESRTKSVSVSNAFKKRPLDTKHTPRSQSIIKLMKQTVDASGAVYRAVRAAKSTFAATVPTPPSLRFDWRDFIYTDGSVLANSCNVFPGIGAGIYIPENPRLGRDETTYAVNCFLDSEDGQPLSVNTINRAELAAIDFALERTLRSGQEEPEVHIATDSLCSIYQVRKANTRPQDLKEHRHLAIINKVAAAVGSQSGIVHLWKVRSHIGIVGNEIADEAAVAVSKGKVPENMLWPYDTPSNNREAMYWLYTRKEPQEEKGPGRGRRTRYAHNDNQPAPVGPTRADKPALTPLANITDALKALVHKLRKLGSSKQDTIYFKAWKDAATQIAEKYSHQFMTSSLVKGYQRKLVIQYRYGLLPTHKLLHRYKKSKSPNCPLCGLPDGGHHAMSGCKHLSDAVTLRHNSAGTEILEAILAGAKGDHVISADVGANVGRQARGLPKLNVHRGVPEEALPPSMPLKLKQHLQTNSIPDAMLYHFNQETQQRTYSIVEIKYCRDTKPEDQEDRAAKQHMDMVRAIRAHDPGARVKQCNLLLGVSGALYQSTVQHLKVDLGIEGPALETLLRILHFLAIEHMEKIWRFRHAKIMERNGRCLRQVPAAGLKRERTTTAPVPAHRTSKKHK